LEVAIFGRQSTRMPRAQSTSAAPTHNTPFKTDAITGQKQFLPLLPQAITLHPICERGASDTTGEAIAEDGQPFSRWNF